MSALNTNDYAYVIPPTAQFKDEDGVPYSAGFVEFYKHGTSEKYITYADWAGSYNPFRIQLNSQGRCVAIIPKGVLLDLYVYNFIGNLAYSRLNIGADGASGDTTTLQFTSHDGSIIIDRDDNVVDLTVKHDDNTYGNITGTTTDNNGAIIFSNVVDGDIELSGGKLIVEAHKLYHITLAMEFATSTLGVNYASCVVRDSDGGSHDFVLDESIAENFVEVSWDTVATSTRLQLALQVPAKFSLNMAHLFIHTVNPVVTGESGGGGSTADIEVTSDDDSVTVNESMVGDTKVFDLSVRSVPASTSEDEGKILSVDDEGNPEWIDSQPFSQQQANWEETNTSDPSYIQNKPDLDQYAKTADLAPVALSNDYTDLNNRPSIPVVNDGTLTIQKNGTTIDTFSANSSSNKTVNIAVPTKTSDLNNDSDFITSSDIPAQVQSNWNESDANDPSYIQNKPSIPAAQVNSDWNASSGVAEILNKPSIRNVPDVGSTDDGKILKATYSGGIGFYAWDTAPSGSSNLVILDYDNISSTYATVSAMLTDIAAGKEIIIRRISTNFTQFYKLAYISNNTPYFIRLQDSTNSGIECIEYGWGYVASNMSFTWNNYSSGIYPREWISTGGQTLSPYIPAGSHTAGEYIFVRSQYYSPFIYKCISDYTQSGSSTRPDQDTTHWARAYLIDILNDTSRLKKLSVTPDAYGNLDLVDYYEGKLLISTGDILSITNSGNVDSVVIQWTAASSTVVPLMPNGYHEASADPAILTVGKTYQFSILNNCYAIVEFA